MWCKPFLSISALFALLALTTACSPNRAGAGGAGGGSMEPQTMQFAPPTAQATAAPRAGVAPLKVRFFGTGSDSDGGSVSYQWNFGDGSAPSSEQSPAHTYSAPGTYVATLTVTDDEGNESIASVTVQARASPASAAPPTAEAYVGTLFGAEPFVVQLYGRGEDPDGGGVVYDWDLNDDGSYELLNQEHPIVTLAAGEHRVRLRVTDDEGNTATARVTLYVCHTVFPSVAPAVAMDIRPLTTPFAGTFTFAAHAADIDGGAVSIAWDFQSDGVIDSTERNPSYTYPAAGIYTARLIVTDDEGETSEATATVAVGIPGPAALVRAEGLTGNPTFDVQFHAWPDAGGYTYSWDFDGDGATDASGSDPHPIHSYTAAGLYQATLTVTDSAGNSAPATLWIAVGHCSEILSPGPGDPTPPPPYNDLHWTEVANNVPSCSCKVTDTLPSGFPAPVGFMTPVYFVMHATGFVPATAPSLCQDPNGNSVGTPVVATRHPALGGGIGVPTPVDPNADITLPEHYGPPGSPLAFIDVYSVKYKITGSVTYNVDLTWNGVPVTTPFTVISPVIKHKTCHIAVGHTGQQHHP